MKKDNKKYNANAAREQREISAYHIGDSINLKQFKSDFTGKLISSSSSELFFKVEEGYLYIFNYGSVAFADISETEKSKILNLLKNYIINPFPDASMLSAFSDDYTIRTFNNEQPRIDFDDLYVKSINEDIYKIVMFNVAQSVALDYYANESETLLEKVNGYALELEKKGKIKLSKRNMLKFIGLTLNKKNRIIDNLYIFDVPEIVWEDKFLSEINSGMARNFDIRTRFKEVQTNFKNIEDSLSIFMELYQHRMSNILEWIIIILILIEVADLLISKLRLLY